ncbi:unnamed protein product [Rotaria socialis]|uniref:Uncharacterized protein n=3 Tax=Rotaria TaxID=231623 RepID=A0A820G513_9BILA|nr:unnamed protein product [Rotaria magnacalcarata]CAF4648726.1 unnamed protein product [Rotaria socialis]
MTHDEQNIDCESTHDKIQEIDRVFEVTYTYKNNVSNECSNEVLNSSSSVSTINNNSPHETLNTATAVLPDGETRIRKYEILLI